MACCWEPRGYQEGWLGVLVVTIRDVAGRGGAGTLKDGAFVVLLAEELVGIGEHWHVARDVCHVYVAYSEEGWHVEW